MGYLHNSLFIIHDSMIIPMKTIDKKLRRRVRIKSKIKGTKDRPRLSVFRSNRYVYAQIIDDEDGKTIVGVSEKHLGEKIAGKKVDRAKALGILLAKKAIIKKVKKVVFDRRNYAYFGRVRQVALGAREGGLDF
jgi:large subunit ribosomal protein L18